MKLKFLSVIFALFAIITTSFAQNDVPDYLCFEVESGTTVSLKKYGNANPNIQYSFDKKTWTDFSEVIVENDCCIYFRGDNPKGFNPGTSYDDYSSFEVSKEFKCSGNVMSLIDGKGETLQIPSNRYGYCFLKLFENCPLTTAPELPATTLAQKCYYCMFSGCKSLTTAPELPATKLTYFCYSSMFAGCSSLTTAPELPATTLAENCYSDMFGSCTRLTTAPVLPATTLAPCCYEMMFFNCQSLVEPPELPATTLANYCYADMFRYCTNLTVAPKLPATTMSKSCYYYMFGDCKNLITAPDLPATTLAEDCYRWMFSGCKKLQSVTVNFNSWPENGFTEWMKDVAAKGVFICPSNLPQQTGINYIPEGWNVKYIEDLKNITIPETSKPYITISETTEIESGSEVSFSVTDRTDEGYTATVIVQGTEEIETTKSGNDYTFTMPAGNVSITATYTPIEYNITANEFVTTNKTKATINDKVTFSVTDRINDGYKLDKILVNGAEFSGTEFEMKNYLQDVIISAVYSKIETASKPEIITDGNVEINLPDNIQENSLVYFTVAQKEGYSAFVYVNGLLTDEYSFVFKGKVEIKVDYKEFSVTDITLETEGYCAGDVINMTFTTDNFAKQYEITFSDEGLKEGFKNIDFKDVTAYQKQLEAFKIPENAKPGKYHAFIRVMDSHGSRSKNFVFEFEVFYPNNIIETKYSDLICVNNFNNEFIGYQWLKNNKEVFGENRQFFFDLPFLNGIYSVVLTKNNGDKIRTCNFEVKDIKQKMFVEKSVKVYPNPAKSGEDINLELSGFDNFNGVYILIYNQLGTVISKISNIKNLNTLSLKRGFYTGTVIDKNEKLNFKIIVND